MDREARFILDNMTAAAVKKEVDCIIGQGACDNLGSFSYRRAQRTRFQRRLFIFSSWCSTGLSFYLANIF